MKTTTTAMAFCVLVGFLAGCTTPTETKIEYHVEAIPDTDWDERLAELGAQGWQLIDTRRENACYDPDDEYDYTMECTVATFQREVPA